MLDVSAFASMLLWMPHILDVVAHCHLQAGVNLSATDAALVSAFLALKTTGSFPQALLQVAKDIVTPKIVKDAAKQVRAVLFRQQMHAVSKAKCLCCNNSVFTGCKGCYA